MTFLLRSFSKNINTISKYYRNDSYGDKYYDIVQKTSFKRIMDYRSSPLESALYTNNKIKFKNLELGCNIKDVIRLWGKPIFKIDHNYQNITHLTLHYKFQQSNFKTKVTLYFIDNLLFCGQFFFKNMNSMEEILNTINAKYLNHQKLDENFCIIDAENNIIKADVNFSITLNYISGDQYFTDHFSRKQNILNEAGSQEINNKLNILNDFL
jgi:hypothetical protein